MLGRKQHIKNSEWLGVLKDIERICSRAEIDRLAANAVSEIRERCQGKRAAYSWSGGKDSLVLGDLCEQAGVKQCFIVICDLEYPAFLQWVTDHMPDELEVINTRQNLTWLAQHQDMLFPQDAATAAKWFHIVQHTGQARYYKEHHLDLILLGRRKADGNFVGRGGAKHLHQRPRRYSVLAPLGLDARTDIGLYPLSPTRIAAFLRLEERLLLRNAPVGGKAVDWQHSEWLARSL